MQKALLHARRETLQEHQAKLLCELARHEVNLKSAEIRRDGLLEHPDQARVRERRGREEHADEALRDIETYIVLERATIERLQPMLVAVEDELRLFTETEEETYLEHGLPEWRLSA